MPDKKQDTFTVTDRRLFTSEGELREEFFSYGAYHNALRMCAFQRDYLASRPRQR